MRKTVTVLMLMLLVLGAFVGCGASGAQGGNGKLKVYTSVYPLYDFAKKVGGDKITVFNMVPAGTEPHDWEPSPSDITNLEKADVFIYNGAGMENWVEKVLGSIQNKKLIAAEASKDITLIKGNHNGEEELDPHVWLNPAYAKIEMEAIKNSLIQADSANLGFYETNYKKYSAEFDALDKEFKDNLSTMPKKDIIVAHEAFGYLCGAYGLNQYAIEGLTPDSEPDSARMSEIIEFAKEHKVKTIFFEELVSPKVAQTIAKEIGAKTEVLNPIEGLSGERQAAGEDYFSVMRQNLNTLKSALQGE